MGLHYCITRTFQGSKLSQLASWALFHGIKFHKTQNKARVEVLIFAFNLHHPKIKSSPIKWYSSLQVGWHGTELKCTYTCGVYNINTPIRPAHTVVAYQQGIFCILYLTS